MGLILVLASLSAASACSSSSTNPDETNADAGACDGGTSVCASAKAECGQISSGGCLVDCGSCSPGLTCGGAGVKNKCGCQPKSCTELAKSCGLMQDGCGGIVDCGTCSTGLLCSDTGKCATCTEGAACAAPKPCVKSTMHCTPTPACADTGFVDAGTLCGPGLNCDGKGNCVCTPKTCQALGVECGTAADGCGGTLQCPACPGGKLCDSGGKCGSCVQGAPCQASAPCKTASMDCSSGSGACADNGNAPVGTSCGTGQECDGAGNCKCKPKSCADLGKSCGTAGDGCGGSIDCGPCANNKVCNTSGQCVDCTQGASCAASQACHTATVDCSGGQPVCTDTGLSAPGVSCGAGQVCDGAGSCVPCAQGTTCQPSSECATGTTDCSSGSAVCQQTGLKAINTACNTGATCPYVCDATGNCSPLLGMSYFNDGTYCGATAYYCLLNGPPPAPSGFSQFSPPASCAYQGCQGNSCQINWCMPCPSGDCTQCPQ